MLSRSAESIVRAPPELAPRSHPGLDCYREKTDGGGDARLQPVYPILLLVLPTAIQLAF